MGTDVMADSLEYPEAQRTLMLGALAELQRRGALGAVSAANGNQALAVSDAVPRAAPAAPATAAPQGGALPEGFTIDDGGAGKGGALPEGFTVDEAPRSGPADFVMSLPHALLHGLASGIAGAGQAGAVDSMGIVPEKSLDAIRNQNPEDLVKKAETDSGVTLPRPQGTWGRYGDAVGNAAGNPLSYIGPGSLLAKGAAAAASGAGSELAGDIADWLGNKVPGLKAAAQLVGGLVGGHIGSKTPQAISPNATENVGRVADADALAREGIPITAGDRVGDTQMQRVESNLQAGRNEDQLQELTRAAGRRIGLNDPYLTLGPDGVFTQRMNQIQGRFDGLANQGNGMTADPQLARDMTQTYGEVTRIPGVYPEATQQATRAAIRRVGDALTANGGTLPNADYQTLRSDLASGARNAEHPQTSAALNDIVEALDDNFERSNPQIAGQYGQARRDYRNALVLERALTANKDGAGGTITPNALATASKQIYGRRAFAKGQGDLAELGQQAQNVLGGTHNTSQTAHFERLNGIIRGMSAAGGALLGAHMGGAEGAVLGHLQGETAVAPLIEPGVRRVVKTVRMSGPANAYLGNQITGGAADNSLGYIPGLLTPLMRLGQ